MDYLTDNYKVAADSLAGGNVEAIVLRQAMILKALFEAKARKQPLAALDPVRNPMPFVVGVPVTTRLQETYTYQADVTGHAVESGVLFTDHVILHPLRIDLSFEVSNWEDGHSEYALDLLETIFAARIPLELITTHKKIPNMVMTALQADNSVPHWGKLAFRASFQQLKLVTLETVKYPAKKVEPTAKTGGVPAQKSAESPKSSGQQTPRESVLLKGIKGLFQ